MSNTSSVPLTRHRTSGKKRFHSEATVLIKFSDVWRATVSNENLCTSAMSIRQQRRQAFLLFKLKVMTGIVRESLCIWERFIRRIAKDDISFSGSFNHRSKITTYKLRTPFRTKEGFHLLQWEIRSFILPITDIELTGLVVTRQSVKTMSGSGTKRRCAM